MAQRKDAAARAAAAADATLESHPHAQGSVAVRFCAAAASASPGGEVSGDPLDVVSRRSAAESLESAPWEIGVVDQDEEGGQGRVSAMVDAGDEDALPAVAGHENGRGEEIGEGLVLRRIVVDRIRIGRMRIMRSRSRRPAAGKSRSGKKSAAAPNASLGRIGDARGARMGCPVLGKQGAATIARGVLIGASRGRGTKSGGGGAERETRGRPGRRAVRGGRRCDKGPLHDRDASSDYNSNFGFNFASRFCKCCFDYRTRSNDDFDFVKHNGGTRTGDFDFNIKFNFNPFQPLLKNQPLPHHSL